MSRDEKALFDLVNEARKKEKLPPLTLNATLVSQAQNEEVKRLTEASYTQNEEVKRISGWAAIIFAPTLIAAIYGMNFDMPELHWAFGYPFSIALMIITSVGLWLIFRRRGWL